MKNCRIALVILFFLSACGTHTTAPSGATEGAAGPHPDSFFPVTSFIRGQMLVLDSLPVTPLQLTTIHKKVDSVWLTKQQLKPLLEPFLTPVISETNLTKYFRETRFNDQTLNAVTLTYDPVAKIPDSIPLRHWDVYIDPEKGTIRKVYLVKSLNENGQRLTQQLTWQSEKMARITTILNKPDGSLELVKEVEFTWSFSNPQ